jgi:hypothetical protein
MSSKPDTTDLDDLIAAPERPGPSECGICWALERMDPVTREKMKAVLARPVGAVSHAKVIEVLHKRGFDWIGRDIVSRHRLGERLSCRG